MSLKWTKIKKDTEHTMVDNIKTYYIEKESKSIIN